MTHASDAVIEDRERCSGGTGLAPSGAEMQEMTAAAVQRLAAFADERGDAPTVDLAGADEVARRLLRPPGEVAQPLELLLDEVFTAARKSVDTANPGYLAFIPGGGLFAAALGEFLAYGLNRFVTQAARAPACAAIENSVLQWLGSIFSMPSTAQGILTSGGSMANFSAIVTARRARAEERLDRAVAYASSGTHLSVRKGMELAGFPSSALRILGAPGTALDATELAARVAQDRAAGLRPFLVVANAGTTDAGVIDPLDAIADVARANELWCHIDGAYGGMFALTDRGAAALRGIERADSITVDPHKGLFLPYGTGALLVREGAALRRAHRGDDASYHQDIDRSLPLPSFDEYSPELSREFRGLRVWLPLHLHGVSAFRDALDERLTLAQDLWDGLGDVPDVVPGPRPALSIVTFRHRRGNRATLALLDRVNASRRVHLSSTTIGGRVLNRACILSFRTDRARVQELLDLVRRIAPLV